MVTNEKTKTVEAFFLNIFKYTVLVFMTLALLGILILIPLAAVNYFQTPTPAKPAQLAPTRAINPEDFKKFLIEAEKQRLEQEKKGNKTFEGNTIPAAQAPEAIVFATEAITLYKCQDAFARAAKQDVAVLTEAQQDEQLGAKRRELQAVARNPFLGEKWIEAFIPFACGLLNDPALAKLKEEGLIGAVNRQLIPFHARAFGQIQREIQTFNNNEKARVLAEEAAEAARVSSAKATALVFLTVAGGLFGAFMLLALYLLIAKAENNLREISERIEPKSISNATVGTSKNTAEV